MTSNLGATSRGAGSASRASRRSFSPESSSARSVARSAASSSTASIASSSSARWASASCASMLRKELNECCTGAACGREWAVEWDESAIEFLLHKGFTPTSARGP